MKLPSISSEQWQELGTLFDRLAEQAPQARDLDAVDCDPAVRRVLAEMLAGCDTDDAFVLDQTIQRIATQTMNNADLAWSEAEFSGHRFGPWQAIETIARGGMSLVLRGKRVDGQFDKEVAIKLLPGRNDSAGQRPLAEEIRILARLEHPGIARLIDGGIDPDGVRYLVMEYVRGSTLNECCLSLDLEQRLDLFDQVLAAVAFAHRQLVVHCDIKPANILVTDDGQVRLVDFGIANLIDRSTDHPSCHRGWFCSPAYAAPEQLRGEPPSITQDVFSLGVVLYELITGTRLRDNRTATRLWLGVDQSPGFSIEPRRINPGIDRDLEVICLRALAQKNTDRYATVDALKDDLARRRRHFPVTARGSGRTYRLAKFIRRHHLELVGAAVVAGVALAGALGVHWQTQQAREQAIQAQANAERAMLESRRAQASRDFLVELFQSSDPDVARGSALTARELLDLGEFQIRSAFKATPELRSEMLVLLGNLYRNLGDFERAGRLLQEGLDLADSHNRADLRASALHGLGVLESQAGRHQAALSLLEQAETSLMELGLIPGPAHAGLLEPLLAALGHARGHDQAISRARAALALIRDHPDIDPVVLHDYLVASSGTLLASERLDEAEALLREAMALDLSTDATPTRRWKTHANLLHIVGRRGDIESALMLSRQAAQLADQIFPPGHLNRAEARVNLAISLCFVGRLDEAEAHLQDALDMFRARYPDDNHPSMGMVHSAFGLVLLHAERYAEAREHLELARRLTAAESARDPLRYLMASSNLAMVLARSGQAEKATELATDLLDQAYQLFPPGHFRLGWFRAVLAETLFVAGDQQQALAELERTSEFFAGIGFEEPVVSLYTRILHARALAADGQIDAALDIFEQALKFADSAGINAAMEKPRSLVAYKEFLFEIARPDARERTSQSLVAVQQEFGQNHPSVVRLQQLLDQH
jgi:eukaryotic-like serine/threonine-protein kinase